MSPEMDDVAARVPYDQLTLLGKLRRQRPLAARALAQYPIEVIRYDMISYDTNFLYKVHAVDGEKYVLRLAAQNWRTFHDLRSEVMWLDALAVPHGYPGTEDPASQ